MEKPRAWAKKIIKLPPWERELALSCVPAEHREQTAEIVQRMERKR